MIRVSAGPFYREFDPDTEDAVDEFIQFVIDTHGAEEWAKHKHDLVWEILNGEASIPKETLDDDPFEVLEEWLHFSEILYGKTQPIKGSLAERTRRLIQSRG